MPNPWIQKNTKEKKKRMLPLCEIKYNVIFISKLNQTNVYTIALFTLFARSAQSGRRTSFGNRVWFIESHTLLFSFYLLIYLFIYT